MNEETSAGPARQRRSRLRAGALTAALAGIALLTSACSGGPATLTAAQKYQKDIKYAQCMRSHGEPSWPDPNSQGSFVFDNPGNPLDPSSPQYQSANKACQKLLPNGRMGFTPAELRQAMSKALKFSACMRAHGIANFPDPVSHNGGVIISGRGIDMNSPQLQAARQACRSLSPLGGGGPA
jgi:hypothetical protein